MRARLYRNPRASGLPKKDCTAMGLNVLMIALRSSGFHVSLLCRIAHSVRANLGGLGRVLSGLCFWFGRHWVRVFFAPSARIYGLLILPHPQGIAIGPNVLVGPRAWLLQNVTLGDAPGKVGLQVI
jgi:serine acetyltransferase